MKLKNQFFIFIIATIFMPFICIAGILSYHYLTDPGRTLLKDFKTIKSLEANLLTSRDWDTLQSKLEKRPPHAETAIIIEHNKILFSNIPDLETGQIISDKEIFKCMEINSRDYFYQFAPVRLEDRRPAALIISRLPRRSSPRRKTDNRFILNMLVLLGIFALFTITFIIQISATISRSISFLEKKAERIANGELEAPEDKKNADSKKKAHWNEITSLTENLEKMRQSLKENEERRTRFIMGISHDLRTPVAVIKGYAEALSDGTADNPAMIKNALEIIGTKTGQLESMIETLINYVKLNSSAWREQLICQPIAETLEEFAKSSITTGNVFKRNVSASIKVSKELSVPFSKQLLSRALENIFSNAIRYSRDGDSISITASQDSENIKISIADTGIGISEEDRQHIFDLFYKASNSRREGGMGIGLAVVKNIIDAHQWKISVSPNEKFESESSEEKANSENGKKGCGTVFTILIPIQEATQGIDSKA